MSSYQNPLGFTRETAALLTGLRANLSEFENREIGFDDLKYLTDEDLVVLNVGEKFDHDSFNKMKANLKKRHVEKSKEPADVLKMLGVVRRQLDVIDVYMQCLYQLSPGLTDYFLENDINLKVSDALLSGTDCVLADLENLEKAIDVFQPKTGTEMDDFTVDRLDRLAENINDSADGMDYGLMLVGLGLGLTSIVIINKFIF